MTNKARKETKKNKNIQISVAQMHVLSTFNNIIISLTQPNGNTVYQCSSGMVGASGSKKASSYFASMVTRKVMEFATTHKTQTMFVIFKGPGINGRDAVVKVLNEYSSIVIYSLQDVTPVPHNGCRSRKRRRT